MTILKILEHKYPDVIFVEYRYAITRLYIDNYIGKAVRKSALKKIKPIIFLGYIDIDIANKDIKEFISGKSNLISYLQLPCTDNEISEFVKNKLRDAENKNNKHFYGILNQYQKKYLFKKTRSQKHVIDNVWMAINCNLSQSTIQTEEPSDTQSIIIEELRRFDIERFGVDMRFISGLYSQVESECAMELKDQMYALLELQNKMRDIDATAEEIKSSSHSCVSILQRISHILSAITENDLYAK